MRRKDETPPLPEPQPGVDFYLSEWRRYTVSIDVEVGGFAEDEDDVDMCSKAVEGLRDGSLDGGSQVVHSEKIKDVELDFKTDLPFHRGDWMKAKWHELGYNEFGEPLRPGEKTRPPCETTLADFPDISPLMRLTAWIRRQWRAVQGAV